MIRLVLLGITLLAVNACSIHSPRPQNGLSPEQGWQQHQQQLQGLTLWQLSGRLAVSNEEKAWHMKLSWHQDEERYLLNIIAPLGQGAMRLEGDSRQVVMLTDDGERFESSDPELLLYQQLGWKVPISALRYWVLGLEAPGEARKTLDEYGRLSQLEQSGWQIRFLDYQTKQGFELPRKVFINNHRAQIKLIIGDWQLLNEAGA